MAIFNSFLYVYQRVAICDLKIRQIRSLVAVLMAARPISEGGYGLGRSAGRMW